MRYKNLKKYNINLYINMLKMKQYNELTQWQYKK